MPGVQILFRFKLEDSVFNVDDEEFKISVEEKLKMLKAIIEEFGLGAKTNVGYGRLKEINEQHREGYYYLENVKIVPKEEKEDKPTMASLFKDIKL